MSFVIGVDFGTQSARAIVVDTSNGDTLGEGIWLYRSGVMTSALSNGTPLIGAEWALADPRDYWEALMETIHLAMQNSRTEPSQIKGLSIAATACTLMPVDKKLNPLCEKQCYANHPHAYAKLWKHHRAQPWAYQMTSIAINQKLDFLNDYGGKISSEWAVPKVLEVLHEDEEVYHAADRFMQFSDWLTARLTGDANPVNGGIAAYKAMWSPLNGFPDEDYLNDVDPFAAEILHVKLRGRMVMAGEEAGRLTKEAGDALGLVEGTCVAMAHTDAHSSVLGVGSANEGDYVYILGTSSCGHLLSSHKVNVPGVTGGITNGLLPGFTCYSAGQASAGDMLDWMIDNALSTETMKEAEDKNVSIHQLLEEKASRKKPGQCGLIALDWWNGNRSILVNADLSGLLMGLTANTRSEDIYRALLDSIAFGHREILENFLEHGLEVGRIIICGGIANKNHLLMQIMADVLDKSIEISSQTQATALGAAICAATAAGIYTSLPDAVHHMSNKPNRIVEPDPENVARYQKVYSLYHRIYNLFGREIPEAMSQLRHFD